MYFWFFKLKKWGKKTAETRRRNCAVLPLLFYDHPAIPYPYIYGSPVHLRQIFPNIYGNCMWICSPGVLPVPLTPF